ncbi:MAG: tRNA (uridine(34)/cytosine(34)/5-carboxymethylaminomethyluridine(34)-2'-O)-methyltransferase TrmL [Gammaproteobacteria bacterium]|uniref:tRNA (uridine(34)/cytosine(34)/5- carboxymethylaminomethyluridine(34)-2'-O)- methyltransferase TrmL n=1 Tax=Pseudomaricurvus alcaniphilus TaxID=1166482 RepID=UPI001409679B|nr:tRNA (uridine(34)/cytosine(34)/5-carboxymethylaminomethyluridine(34)-2'-O)-methyltransferase TrmL [Pseudomaricurvus alcaniphilus]MBR9912510.1 tRNA (uridine(34)/cytosine(34)/5-carboxymethylaminomethyluridine(34)-2'-O)-methyltransferase TrmL [Gammaproteobacteria bacterium]NHN36291.1 tRNA (uridine(34)/cytosine(34)/5-carboxymethylaminomethyluridine(34)-2'-O)-methyltransferase TrmL [Pseudomaricurvus alcaniphilus]
MTQSTTDQPQTLLNVVLYEPEIPPNTGNIIRLTANTGARLHLIEPVAFALDDKRLRRAGLDYGEWQEMQVHASWQQFIQQCQPERLFAISTRGTARFSEAGFRPGDYVVFGPETRGLPAPLLAQLPPEQVLRIPMRPGSRSMNLSNAAAVVIYEAWRQMGFDGAV